MLPLEIPFSTIFIFLLAAAVSLLTSLVNRLLTDPEKSKAWRKEIAEYNAELRKAQRSGDKKRVEKLMKKQQYILQLNSKMAWQSIKVTLIIIAPLLIMWRILGGSYGPVPIAYFPGVGSTLPLPLLGNMSSLYWWYLLCSFLFSTTFSHLFGLASVE
ncbi:MAG: EMC3/TMCO1 family protein [Candidatus Bathyarchaeota archaeon]|nr:EMC3/TMCO1 family protein [Candidatus Bathyarchaeota archaeon]